MLNWYPGESGYPNSMDLENHKPYDIKQCNIIKIAKSYVTSDPSWQLGEAIMVFFLPTPRLQK